jgi:hypothetical protein
LSIVDVPIKALELDEETRIRKITVKDADGIVGIECDFQVAADGLDRSHMPRGDIAGGPDERKGIHGCRLFCILFTLPHFG